MGQHKLLSCYRLPKCGSHRDTECDWDQHNDFQWGPGLSLRHLHPTSKDLDTHSAADSNIKPRHTPFLIKMMRERMSNVWLVLTVQVFMNLCQELNTVLIDNWLSLNSLHKLKFDLLNQSHYHHTRWSSPQKYCL